MLAIKDAPSAANSPSKTANIIINKDPAKNPRPPVFGIFDRDNNNTITAKIMGLKAAINAIGTTIVNKNRINQTFVIIHKFIF